MEVIQYVISKRFFKHFFIKINVYFFSRIRNLDRKYFKRWLLRESPVDKMDIKLLQTLKKINVNSVMRVHDASKGLVPSSLALHPSSSDNHLKIDRRIANISELVAAKFILQLMIIFL